MVNGADSKFSLQEYAAKAKEQLLSYREQREAYDAQVEALNAQKNQINMRIKSYFNKGKQAPTGLESKMYSIDSQISNAKINQHVSMSMEQTSVFSYMRTGGA